ncbi:MAG: hypothetical protein Q9208_002188 [Pyrenodesmia sp. 3 TL-2023]
MLSTWKLRQSRRPWARVQGFWQHVMLWALQQRDHRKALAYLEATISDLHNTAGATRYAIEDALVFLASKHLEGQIPDTEINDRLHRLFCRFAETNNLGNNRKSESIQKVIYLLLQHSDYHHTVTLYDSIVNSKLIVDFKTLTHFLSKFVRLGRTDMAMHVLKRIAVSSADLTSDVVQHSCITLLRTSLNDAERYRIQSHIVTEMLELGIRPGIDMLNAMILNAVEAGDHQTAYAIFETARIHGIRRNTITYSIILKIALHNLDENLVEKIMLMAEEDGALPRNNQLVCCLVTTFMQITRDESGPQESRLCESRYRTMLRVYTRYCDISPLQDLGIYLDVLGVSGTTGPISPPSPQLLSVMIMGFIRLCGQPSLTRELYHRYQKFLAQGHPLIAPTAGTDHLANAFLLCLGQSRHTFAMCPTIIKNMLQPPASAVFKVAKPTVQTWSILLRSYFFNGQRAAAEKTIQMMRSHGIAPNVVTMNTIIAGYAAMQDPGAAVNAMQEMKAAGFEDDSSTYKALARIVKREELLEALQKTAVKTTQARGVRQAGEDSSRVEVEGAVDTATPSLETASLPGLQSPGSDQDSLLEDYAQEGGKQTVNGALLRSVAYQ